MTTPDFPLEIHALPTAQKMGAAAADAAAQAAQAQARH